MVKQAVGMLFFFGLCLLGGPVRAGGCSLSLVHDGQTHTLRFPARSVSLTETMQKQLVHLADRARRKVAVCIRAEIVRQPDDTGRALAARRLKAVQNFLTGRGVSAEVIGTEFIPPSLGDDLFAPLSPEGKTAELMVVLPR